MELPSNLKRLYRHWPLQVCREEGAPLETVIHQKDLREHISWFVRERLSIWEKKTAERAPPYTKDKVLANYRFCNVFREFDRQTIAFHTLLNPLRDDFPCWLLNMFYCRMVARPETVEVAGLLSFDEVENVRVYERLMTVPRPRYGTPYVFPVSVILKSTTPTRELFLTRRLSALMPAVSRLIQEWKGKPVYEGIEEILPLFGFNLRFLWTEVLIDVAYQFPDRVDLFKRFPVGPGALPTFGKIDSGKDPSELAALLGATNFSTRLTYDQKPLCLSAENWEGIGCEYRKYTNLLIGKGRRRVYK
ncbi:MAG TPA: nucleotide kinase domain-containing protein [Candidatus Paceibacterota bacterium]